ncbi:MAG: hypothetical protein IPN14_12730 [Bacteroidetes bacterium]|nr:hypothetical protein [Bacteroidota bacterium]
MRKKNWKIYHSKNSRKTSSTLDVSAQDKEETWVWVLGQTATFSEISKPILGQIFNGPGNGGPPPPHKAGGAGDPLGARNAGGEGVENGDSLMPTKLHSIHHQ